MPPCQNVTIQGANRDMTEYTQEKDFDVEVKVRNGRLLRAIRKHYKSTAAFCREYNLDAVRVSALMTMKVKPINKRGWTQLAADVAMLLGKDPEDLWPDHMKEIKLRRSTASFGADFDEVLQIAQQGSVEKLIAQKQTLDLITEKLTDREKYCLKAHYEMGKTYVEIAEILGRSVERVRQIIFKALRKSRNTAQAHDLMKLATGDFRIVYNEETESYDYIDTSRPKSISYAARELFKDDELS